MVEAKLLLAIVNLIVGLWAAAVCFCRLVHLKPGTPVLKVAPHALMLTGSLVMAFQPWLGHWPTEGHVFCMFAILVYLLHARGGMPKTAR